jgi:MoxR-like ATPase
VTLTLDEVAARATAILSEVERAVVGKRQSLEIVLSGILAGGHVLMEDFPGLGKTLAARSFAQALGLDFARAQFTPDLLPSDLTGSFLYDQRSHEFTFRKGPLFTGLLLADEINRTPPKTQSALLEAMQEGQVTVEGETFALPKPFHVLATANPVEYEGTYPLPEAQLDRFLLRVSFGYPSAADEWEVLQRRMARQQEAQVVASVTDGAGLIEMQQAVETVTVDEGVGQYCVRLVAATRTHQNLLMGASPRASLALLLTSRAMPCCAAGTTSPRRTSRPWRTQPSTTASRCAPSCG